MLNGLNVGTVVVLNGFGASLGFCGDCVWDLLSLARLLLLETSSTVVFDLDNLRFFVLGSSSSYESGCFRLRPLRFVRLEDIV